MFRTMRRHRQLLPEEEARAILAARTSGVLAVLGDDGYPYAVPLSYVYHDAKLWFHGAPGGHKLDALRRCDKASFCVIDQDAIVPAEFTTYFRSVIVFGRVRILEEEAEKRAALRVLAEKYTPGDPAGCAQEVEKTLAHVCLLELTPEQITGKEAIELTRARHTAL